MEESMGGRNKGWRSFNGEKEPRKEESKQVRKKKF